MKTFRYRVMEPELMEDTSLEPEVLNAVLRDIDFVNSALGGYQVTLNAISNLIQLYPQPSYRILDVGCGDGAMLRKIGDYFIDKECNIELHGVDISATSIGLARQKNNSGMEITYHTLDFLKADPVKFKSDIVLSTLTLHHIPSEQVPLFLRQMVKTARIAVLVNDLQRSGLAYYLFKVFSSIFIKTYIARHDGGLSIKKGFRKEELRQFADQIGEVTYRLEKKWAFRYLFTLYPKMKLNYD